MLGSGDVTLADKELNGSGTGWARAAVEAEIDADGLARSGVDLVPLGLTLDGERVGCGSAVDRYLGKVGDHRIEGDGGIVVGIGALEHLAKDVGFHLPTMAADDGPRDGDGRGCVVAGARTKDGSCALQLDPGVG